LKKSSGFEDEAKILKGLINASTALALACKGKWMGHCKCGKPMKSMPP